MFIKRLMLDSFENTIKVIAICVAVGIITILATIIFIIGCLISFIVGLL